MKKYQEFKTLEEVKTAVRITDKNILFKVKETGGWVYGLMFPCGSIYFH